VERTSLYSGGSEASSRDNSSGGPFMLPGKKGCSFGKKCSAPAKKKADKHAVGKTKTRWKIASFIEAFFGCKRKIPVFPFQW